ncbi:hypothetical protein [Mycolicibacterium grossiae]|nr:hypothetical protein [Mycolicibacterium grossiae]
MISGIPPAAGGSWAVRAWPWLVLLAGVAIVVLGGVLYSPA